MPVRVDVEHVGDQLVVADTQHSVGGDYHLGGVGHRSAGRGRRSHLLLGLFFFATALEEGLGSTGAICQNCRISIFVYS